MIKKLRARFIWVAMLSVILVLGTIIAAINITNYSRVQESSDRVIAVLEENGGRFPMEFPIKPNEQNGISPETPFSTRYFTVLMDKDGQVISTDMSKIAGVSQDTAKEYAGSLFTSGKVRGMYEDYKYSAIQSGENTMYIFLDCGRDLFFFRNFLQMSIFISLGGLTVIFILVLIFSKISLKPVEEGYRKQKSFITNASHDIKTPLTIIGAQTEVIELENGESEWTEGIKKQVERLSALTDKLVFLSKMDEDGYKVEMKEISLSDSLLEVSEAYENIAKERGFAYTVEIEQNVLYKGNEDMLKQAFALLLDNAMKYTSEQGKIHVSLKKIGKDFILRFYNDCEGLEKGKHEEIFERFYRRESSRNSGLGGHGIGLSVVNAIVNLHKGKITAFSEDGHGLTICILLK